MLNLFTLLFSRSRRAVVLSCCAVAALLLSGCNRLSPEERLDRVREAYQQQDFMSAELEARKIIDKYPDDPAAMDAHIALANIYQRDGRLDDALTELEAVLQKQPLNDPQLNGIRYLASYNNILKAQKRYDEALKTIDKYAKDYPGDKVVELNLNIGRADIKIAEGQTSEARRLLADARKQTTNTRAMAQFRDLELASYFHDKDTTGAIAYMQRELESSKDENLLHDALQKLIGLEARAGNYEETRKLLQRATTQVDGELEKEPDLRIHRAAMGWLAMLHDSAGSLPSALILWKRVFDVTNDPREMGMVQTAVRRVFETLVQEGKTDEAVAFGEQAAKRYPDLGKSLDQFKQMRQQGKVRDVADTSPMVLKFMADPPILPKHLPELEKGDGGTSGTVAAMSADKATSGGKVAADDKNVVAAEPKSSAPAESGAANVSSVDKATSSLR